ncbi:MAG: hypothetical protein H6835_10375 [Planctomycetes bacterium]|nr:hypothetical protein [Planctomycetota bacterium]
MRRPTAAAFAAFALHVTALAQQLDLDPAAAGPADRIWSSNPDDQDVWLRRRFPLPDKVTTARLVFSCDNECRVLVNGKEVATAASWMDVTVVDLEQLDRDNVVAVEAKNTGGPGAFACWVLWTDAEGEARELISDVSWKVTTTATDIGDGWDAVAFDDSKWQTATASFNSVFGQNLYNGAPTTVHFRNRHSDSADTIAAGLRQLRRALSREAARAALDAIEKAVMAARTQLWREEQAEKARDSGR